MLRKPPRQRFSAMSITGINKNILFEYIDAFNNRTKHTCDVPVELAMSLFNDKNTSRFSAFFKSEKQQIDKDILSIILDILSFTEECFNNLITIILDEIKREIDVSGRYHHLFCYQQKLLSNPNSDFSVVYFQVSNDCTEIPNTIRVLLINDTNGDIWTKNCEIKNIFARNAQEEYIGKYVLSSLVKRDSLVEYAEYTKEEKAPFYGLPEVWQAFLEDKVFYKSNPYITVKTVSDDDDFIKRVQIPF